MKRFLTLWALLALLAVPAWSQTTKNIPERHPVLSQEEILTNIDNTVAQVMQDWKIPGMGVALYKDGQTLLCKGYGVKSYDSGAPVDQHTIFQIGSVSKSFTAAVIADRSHPVFDTGCGAGYRFGSCGGGLQQPQDLCRRGCSCFRYEIFG